MKGAGIVESGKKNSKLRGPHIHYVLLKFIVALNFLFLRKQCLLDLRTGS